MSQVSPRCSLHISHPGTLHASIRVVSIWVSAIPKWSWRGRWKILAATWSWGLSLRFWVQSRLVHSEETIYMLVRVYYMDWLTYISKTYWHWRISKQSYIYILCPWIHVRYPTKMIMIQYSILSASWLNHNGNNDFTNLWNFNWAVWCSGHHGFCLANCGICQTRLSTDGRIRPWCMCSTGSGFLGKWPKFWFLTGLKTGTAADGCGGIWLVHVILSLGGCQQADTGTG